MDSLEASESASAAATALRSWSHVALFALADGVTPAVVRRRLIAHVAGADVVTASPGSRVAGESVPVPGAVARERRHARMQVAAEDGPIVAYIRKPKQHCPKLNLFSQVEAMHRERE